MKTKKTIISIFVFTGIIFAGQKNLYEGGDFNTVPDFLEPTDPAYYKDGTTAVEFGCLIQGIVENDSTDIKPPTTNNWESVTGYFVDFPDNVRGAYNSGTLPDGTPHPYHEGNCGAVGSRNGLATPDPTTPGNYKMGVGGANNELGWLRVFSGTHWTNAVYYGDGRQWSLPGSADYGHAGDIVCSNINPAYIIQFNVLPNNSGDEAQIEGTVANVGNGNNELPYDYLEIVYSGADSGAYMNVETDGSFAFAPGVAGDYIIQARVKDVYTPRPGFPISEEYSVTGVTPEPGLICFLSIFVLGLLRLKFTIFKK